MSEARPYSADTVLISTIEKTFPPSPAGLTLLSQQIHITDKGILITRSYQDRDAFAGILYMRGLLDGLTIWLELNVSFPTETEFNITLKIENPFIMENVWNYNKLNNQPVQMPSMQAASSSATAYGLCVLRCAGSSIGSCLFGCAPFLFDKHLFITCVVGCMPGAGVAVAKCIIDCL